MLREARNVSEEEKHHCHFNKVYGNTNQWMCSCGIILFSPDGIVKGRFGGVIKC